ncbi:hypothetical protein [Tumebacillus lipolyticus]|uniref:Uncharacterized protein n=1 Tax=Tumebacillus lipolyticus TaxID=1280370 RepID=A0ABW4ZS70_9BACL
MNLPLQVYDFIAVLFPGVLLLGIVKREAPGLPIWNDGMQFGTLALLLVIGYLAGQLLAQIARTIESEPTTSWLLQIGRRKRRRRGRLEGRLSSLRFTTQLNEAILSSLSDFYGRPVQPNDPDLFNLAFSPVQDKMIKRDLFLALANMMRSLAVLGFFYGVYLAVEIVLSLVLKWQFDLYAIPLLVLSLLGYIFFRRGFLEYESIASKIPFLAFLAWYRQQKMLKG